MARLEDSRRPRADEPGIMRRGINSCERLRLFVPIAVIIASIALALPAYQIVGAAPAVPAIAQLYVASTATFVGIGDMVHARSEATATRLQDGDLLVAGGIDSNGTPVATAERYDASAATFVSDATMITARYRHTASLLSSGKVLLAGGLDVNANVVGGSELYDPGSGSFEQGGSMLTARSRHTATEFSDGTVLIVGGIGANGALVADAEIYDPNSGTFSTAGGMITPRADHSATLLNDGLVLITGGIGADGFPVANAEIYDPSNATFASAGTMVTPRTGHTATLVQNGKVLIAGGTDSSGFTLAAAEIYDPGSGTFIAAGKLNTARSFHTATLLLDGSALIAGGVGASANGLASAEIYDPAKGAFALDGAMSSPHVGHAAAILETGDVVMVGGAQGPLGPASTPVVTPTPTPAPTTTPVPVALTFVPKRLSFPPGVIIGGRSSVSKPLKITITNPKTRKQNTQVLIEGIQTTGDFGIYRPDTDCGSSLDPAASCHVAVIFSPQSTGKLAGSIVVMTNAIVGPPVQVGLSGAANTGKLKFIPPVLDFSSQKVRHFVVKKFTIKNPNPLPVVVTGISVTKNPTEFAKLAVASACIGVLKPGDTCSLNMAFIAKKRGPQTGRLEVTDDAADSPQKIRMSGVGQ